MNKKHLFTGFAVILLIYSAWRSFDYLMTGLTGVNPTVAVIVSIVFLFASEIGLLLWLHAGVPGATTDAQETIAKTMIGIDFVGSLALGVADLLLHNTVYVVNFSWLDPVLLVAPALLVASNVGAVVLYHLADAEEQLRRADRQLEFEEAQLEITARSQAIKQLQASRREVGEKLAPAIYKDIRDRVTGRTIERFERQAQEKPPAPAASGQRGRAIRWIRPPALTARTNGNGNGQYNAESEAPAAELEEPDPKGQK